ncbi:hypothetical protein AB0C29_02390 [Actinoplanes sp. NPDC048791]|uniref:hypothetical protein n=1 Tax=Actinoplanes sp. NPDC048791 TaxID=3154623 RepID=UPI0033F9D6B0
MAFITFSGPVSPCADCRNHRRRRIVPPGRRSAASTGPSPGEASVVTAVTTRLLKDKSGFDHNSKDFDILTAAVLAVLKAKPNSPVKVLTRTRGTSRPRSG